jgi:DNA-binding NarL/FixJ family response regulator
VVARCATLTGTVADIVEAATGAESEGVFGRRVLELIADVVGFDLAFIGVIQPPFREPLLDNIARECWDALRSTSQIGAELQVMARAARATGGVILDQDVFSAHARGRMEFYESCVRPNGTKSFLAVHLALHGREVAVMHLCRTSPHQVRFSAEQLDALQRLRPALALGFGVFAHEPPRPAAPSHAPGWETLTPREREIARLAALGYTNREIAVAFGSSANTVRNHVVSIFRKMEATTRAELAALVGRPDAE